MGRMSSILKPMADRYNQKTQAERYQFRRLLRSLVKWYGYVSQVARMFDEELHKENVFCAYLLKLLPLDEVSPLDLEGKLQLEYYKLQRPLPVPSNWNTPRASTSQSPRKALSATTPRSRWTRSF